LLVGASGAPGLSIIFHLAQGGGGGTLLVPEWPSAVFWPLIFDQQAPFAHLRQRKR